MSRRKQSRVFVRPNAGDVQLLPFTEIKMIVRAAEDLIGRGGRTLLCKILKGSSSKEVTERQLDQNPAWGYYRELTNEQILTRIDWTILNGYLRIEYSHRLPLLCYTQQGLEIEIDTITDEKLDQLRSTVATKTVDAAFFERLRDAPRETVEKLLDKIEATRDPSMIPALSLWAAVAYKKVRTKINRTIAFLLALPLPEPGSGK
jgi:RQC domain